MIYLHRKDLPPNRQYRVPRKIAASTEKQSTTAPVKNVKAEESHHHQSRKVDDILSLYDGIDVTRGTQHSHDNMTKLSQILQPKNDYSATR